MTNMELYHYGIKGMRWGHRKARPTMSGAARSARRKRIAKRVALGVGAAAGAAALGYGAYRGKKYISTPHGAAQQGIDRVGGAARKAGSAVGSYALGGKHSSRRAAASRAAGKVDQGRAAVSALADAYRTRRKYQGRHVSRGAHAAHFAYDTPGEALYHFALDPYGRYAIL